MIILSDCLTNRIDEGCLKVANSLTKKVKEADPSTIIVSYNRNNNQSDLHLRLNKFFINHSLFSLIRKRREKVLYIPFSSNTTATALRLFILSLFSKNGVQVIFVLRHPMGKLQKFLLKLSKAEIIVLSKDSYDFYKSNGFKSTYLKTGIDTSKFVPVEATQKALLKKKYGIPDGMKVVLHVGHLKKGRNIDKLLNVKDDKFVYLVVSSVTESEKDDKLREAFNNRKNTKIEDSYLEHIEEVYQMSDVYVFPVQQMEECIDIPLSVLEAVACNIPVVTTDCGELKEFKGKLGFKFVETFDKDSFNFNIETMIATQGMIREAVLPYDWNEAVKYILNS